MTIYVDKIIDYSGKGKWCHMASDSSLDELHQFAELIGLKRGWFQNHHSVPHYDLRPNKRSYAIQKGAIEVSSQELFRRCYNPIRCGFVSSI